MKYYNANYDADDIDRLKKAIVDQMDNVSEASDVLNQRGEKIQIVITKADGLRSESRSYFDSSKKVRRNALMKKIKLIVFIILILLVIAYFISVVACGWDYSKCGGN